MQVWVVSVCVCSDNHKTLFRGNSIATKAMEAYMKLVGEKVNSNLVSTVTLHILKCHWETWSLPHYHLWRTRKLSYRRQTRATRKHAKNCSNSTCLQRCRWQYWPIFMRLAAVASEICEIPRNSLKIQTMKFKVIQDHRSWCQSKAHMWLAISY